MPGTLVCGEVFCHVCMVERDEGIVTLLERFGVLCFDGCSTIPLVLRFSLRVNAVTTCVCENVILYRKAPGIHRQ